MARGAVGGCAVHRSLKLLSAMNFLMCGARDQTISNEVHFWKKKKIRALQLIFCDDEKKEKEEEDAATATENIRPISKKETFERK